jgi:hypothetical protein
MEKGQLVVELVDKSGSEAGTVKQPTCVAGRRQRSRNSGP